MEPSIQYAKTSDGVSIAYYAIGQGPVVMLLMGPWSHLEAEWQIEFLRAGYTAQAQRATLVRLDPRGCGLSDRDPEDFALDSLVLDIEAVVDKLGFEELRINAMGLMNLPALAYTARHPDKVTHLVQAPAAASGRDMSNERLEKLRELAAVDWELASETFIRTLYSDFTDQQVAEFTGLLRASVDADNFERIIDNMLQWDADADAAALSTPTLLIHERNNPNFSMDVTRRVAGLIKDSRVAFVDSAFEAVLLPQRFFEGDVPDGEEAASIPAATSPEAGVTHTILFTDMEGSTALSQRLGDAGAQEVRRAHNTIVRDALKAQGGSEIKHTGDGIMASFTTASAALECAIAIQRGVAAHVEEHPDSPLGLCIGLNAGEPIAEERDLFGTSVDLAARICAHAGPGEILASDVVRQLTAGKEFLFSDLGETELRGFEDPVKLWEVRWRDEGSP